MREPDPTQRAEQDIGEGGEPQAYLVGPHGCRGSAVGEQIELTFLDPVLHLAARAVDRLIEVPCLGLRGLSEVTTKRGLALPTTRRPRLQLSSVDQTKSRKRRAGLPLDSASTRAAAISAVISA